MKGKLMHPAGRFRAFTLVELLVALSVTMLLLLFVNGVFRSISAGVSTGMATSEIVQTGRVVADQIARDADHMIMPEDDGVLVIINQELPEVPFVENDADLDNPIYDRRVDQIMFVRSASDLESITPSSNTTFTPNGNFTASSARVTYGHAVRVDPERHLEEYLDDSDPIDPPVLGEGHNAFSTQWVLGRHALLLSTDVSGGIYAEGAWSDGNERILGDGRDESRLYHGLADIAASGLVNEHEDTEHAMVGEYFDGNDSNSDTRIYRFDGPLPDLGAGLPLPDFFNHAEYADRALMHTFAHQRLWVNPAPDYDFEADLRYNAWQIAQTHPSLARGVTDFVVEFAGDYDQTGSNEGRTDLHLTGANAGRIIWYSFDAATEHLDTLATAFNIPPGNPTSEAPIWMRDPINRPYDAFIFRHGDEEETNWPHLIRIRYRVADSRGQLSDADGVPGRMYEQIIRVRQD